mgnify:CR=1 FL=1
MHKILIIEDNKDVRENLADGQHARVNIGAAARLQSAHQLGDLGPVGSFLKGNQP